jgi:O-antigen/teichoic acid export membrane protein
MDMVVAAVGLALLAWLGTHGGLSAVRGLAVLAVACAAGVTGWFIFARRGFVLRGGQVVATLKHNWRLGRWFLAGQLAVQAQGYVAYWLALAMVGAAATGIYAACMSVVGFANPLLFGAFNLLVPRSVRAFRKEGGIGVRRQAFADAGLLGGIMAVFCVVIFFFGERVVHALYPATTGQHEGEIVFVLAVTSLIASMGVPAAIALASTERAKAFAAVTGANALLNVVLVFLLLPRFGLVGAAYAVLIGETVGSIARWYLFLALVRENHPPAGEDASP